MAVEVTWKNGLVLKGNGLCHGISGNAYLLLSATRFNEGEIPMSKAAEAMKQEYRTKAYYFA